MTREPICAFIFGAVTVIEPMGFRPAESLRADITRGRLWPTDDKQPRGMEAGPSFLLVT